MHNFKNSKEFKTYFVCILITVIFTIVVEVIIVAGRYALMPLLVRRETIVFLSASSLLVMAFICVRYFRFRLNYFATLAFVGFGMYWLAFALIMLFKPLGMFGYKAMFVALFFVGIPGYFLMLCSTLFNILGLERADSTPKRNTPR